MSTIKDFNGCNPTWCPGCGNWSIIQAIKMALVKQDLTPSDIAVSFDIGCSGNMNDFLNAYAIHGLHGRAIATAIGIKLANHKMPVLVVGGDGGLYGEGGNHFLHACRGNHDITVIVHDNRVYGLTTGQATPTSQKGFVAKTSPGGVIETPINGLMLAITQGATFVAQGFSSNLRQVSDLISAGINHKGFSLINILQPCVTFNKINTYDYFKEKTYELVDHDSNNLNLAIEKSQEMYGERLPLGILYQVDRPAYHEELAQLNEHCLVDKGDVELSILNKIVEEFA